MQLVDITIHGNRLVSLVRVYRMSAPTVTLIALQVGPRSTVRWVPRPGMEFVCPDTEGFGYAVGGDAIVNLSIDDDDGLARQAGTNMVWASDDVPGECPCPVCVGMRADATASAETPEEFYARAVRAIDLEGR